MAAWGWTLLTVLILQGCAEASARTPLVDSRESAEALAEAVGSLLGDPTDRRRMGIEARRRMVRRFSVEQVVRETFYHG